MDILIEIYDTTVRPHKRIHSMHDDGSFSSRPFEELLKPYISKASDGDRARVFDPGERSCYVFLKDDGGNVIVRAGDLTTLDGGGLDALAEVRLSKGQIDQLGDWTYVPMSER